jgi:NADH-ubiquinone oxidoreductase chain 5
MAAPTPVSALVHSSTLVTAGVYLLIRFHEVLGANSILFFVGGLTMFMSGLGANFEFDLKKIIALSTLRQLGLMVTALGIGCPDFSFFHLLTHAMFKSLLFLCAGVFIHAMGDVQDIRNAGGGLLISCPVTSLYFIGCSMALCGFPFLSGFYSKDLILEKVMLGEVNLFMGVVVLVATLFTLTYSVRLIFYLYLKNFMCKRVAGLGESLAIIVPMRGLIFLACVAGGGLRIFIFPLVLVNLPLVFKVLVILALIIFFLVSTFLLGGKEIYF